MKTRTPTNQKHKIQKEKEKERKLTLNTTNLCSQRTLQKLGEFEAFTLNYGGYDRILWEISLMGMSPDEGSLLRDSCCL
jgi:hypothetical protein